MEDKYALSDAWARGGEFKTPFDYTLQNTGQTVLIRRLDMGDLLKFGIAEELDIMSKALMADEKPQVEQDTKQTISDAVMKSGNFEQMEKMINVVCVGGIIKPKIQNVPLHEQARQPGQIYVDSIPFGDRMELFGVIFDAEGLATFLPEQNAGVGDVANVTDVPLPPDRPVDVRPEDTEGVLLQPGSVPVGPDGGIEDGRSGASVSDGSQWSQRGPASSDGEAGNPEQVLGDRVEAVQES
jgi:hypothetical protein